MSEGDLQFPFPSRPGSMRIGSGVCWPGWVAVDKKGGFLFQPPPPQLLLFAAAHGRIRSCQTQQEAMSIPCLLVPLSSHAAASACRILSKSSSPALPAGLTLQRRRTSRRCLVVSHCAADPTCQPSPEEDPGVPNHQPGRPSN